MQGEAEGPSRGCPAGAKCPQEAKTSPALPVSHSEDGKEDGVKPASEAGFLFSFTLF